MYTSKQTDKQVLRKSPFKKHTNLGSDKIAQSPHGKQQIDEDR